MPKGVGRTIIRELFRYGDGCKRGKNRKYNLDVQGGGGEGKGGWGLGPLGKNELHFQVAMNVCM